MIAGWVSRRARGVYLASFAMGGEDDLYEAFSTERAAREWCDEQAWRYARRRMLWQRHQDGSLRGSGNSS